MVYSLAMFHSMLLERRKYKGYGWTKEYDFNNSDFKICLDILRTYSRKFVTPQEFPWKAIQELICINYGSRFTNHKDSELLQTYAEHFFNPNLIIDKNYNLSSSPDFPYPLLDDSLFEKFKNTTSSENTNANRSDYYLRMCFFKEEATKLRPEQPEVFGLHFNAEISSQIQDNLELLDSIRILNHDLVASAEAKSTDEIVLNKIKFAREKLPKPLESDKKKFEMLIPDDNGGSSGGDKTKNYNPINILLYQEAVKYNKLLELINNDLINFEKALLGHITLTPQIQTSIHSISEDKIPIDWLCYYLSTKSFIHFIEDLNKRFDFFRMWIGNGLYTPTYYLGYFTNPNSFITAIKQRFSLLNKVAFNNITLQFKVCNDNEDKAMKNTNGYVIQGIEIEGGYWDKKNMGIREEMVQELTNELPNIIITPTASEDRLPNFGTNALLGEAVVEVTRNFPLYYIPIRGDYLGRSSYIMDITLNIVREKDKEGIEKSREEILSYWIKKGTCLLLSKSD
jgi:dynein heavy chain